MSSARFPGKMLAPLLGRPLLSHVVQRVSAASGFDRVILLTSTDPSDDPLAIYAETCLGVEVFRGDLLNVARRFQDCLRRFPCEWFARICGDSPVIDPDLLSLMNGLIDEDTDLITNVAKRTFPSGQSIELVRSSTFLELDTATLEKEAQEHVTLYYYRHSAHYRIREVRCSDASMARRRLVVDSLEDLRMVADVMQREPELTTGYALVARASG